ncbi:MAG: hypothetical protein FWG68_11755 [Defluviitaleaceae bacterium]|nr:hypothetical protein [Defluviitaleaceae bacterium]
MQAIKTLKNKTSTKTVSRFTVNTGVRKHIPLAERLKKWDGTPYSLNEEDNEWLTMESCGDETRILT